MEDFKLYVSKDFGLNYEEVMSANNLEDLNDSMNGYEEDGGVRWYVGQGDEVIEYGTYQRKYIEMVLAQKETGKPMMVNTDDPMVKKVLEGKGIEVQGTHNLISKLLGVSEDDAIKMLSGVEKKMKDMSPEDMKDMIDKMQELEKSGVVQTYKG